MKAVLLILVLVVVVLGAAYYLYPRSQSQQPTPISGITNQSSTSVTTNTSTPIVVAINSPTVFPTEKDLNDIGIFKNASTGVTISFKYVFTGAPNNGSDIYINQKKIGGTGGVGIGVLGFSPDNNYFALESKSVSGAYRYDFAINVVDIKNNKVLLFKPKIQAGAYPSGELWDTTPYVDSYQWNQNSKLDVTSYLLGTDYNEANNTIKYYRVSPKETWEYDLVAGTSTLIQTIP